MITIHLDDPNGDENFKALLELRSMGIFSDEELQVMYDRQIEADRERDEDEP